jgi:hypothetical protein
MAFEVLTPCRLLGPSCIERNAANPEGWPLYSFCPQCLLARAQKLEAAVLATSSHAAQLAEQVRELHGRLTELESRAERVSKLEARAEIRSSLQIPKSRDERGQMLRNVWAHIVQFTTAEQRERLGISEDRGVDMSVLRLLSELYHN